MNRGELKWKASQGISLLELLLALAIISLLFFGVLRYYRVTRLTEEVNLAVESMQSILSGVERWRLGSDSQELSLKRLIDLGLVPAAVQTHPWGGEVTVVEENNHRVRIELMQLPKEACQNLQDKLENLAEPGSGCVLQEEFSRYVLYSSGQ